jgi:VanZ family protein
MINKLSIVTMIFIIFGCVAYGGLLEVMQATVFSQRSGDWLDFIANSFGCLIGLWFFRKNKFRFSSAS